MSERDLSTRRLDNGFWTLAVLIVLGVLIKAIEMSIGIATFAKLAALVIGGGIAAIVALCVVVYVLGYLTTDVPMKARRWLSDD